LEELVDEAKLVIDARRFEDPEQGRLFVESAPNGNGSTAPAEEDEKPKRRGGGRPKAAAPAPGAEDA